MKKVIYTLLLSLIAFITNAQLSFTNANQRLLNPDFHSGCAVSVTDWNGDGLDDIVRLDAGRFCYVEVQQTNQQFNTVYLGDFGGEAWAMAVADVDDNGYRDVIADGSGGIGLLQTNSMGTGATMTWLPNSNFFLQNLTFGDFNNDGMIDIFACDDVDASHIYLNAGSGTFALSSIIDFDLPNGSDNSGNYGSVWTDFDNDGDMDLYIAKCRQGVSSPSDPRRIDVLFVNDGSNNYTEMAATYGVANGWQTWTASFGDIDNDGDLDLLATNHDFMSQIFENDGTGHYTDITTSTGFDISDMTPIESVMEDFDNDGYVDIFVTGGDNLPGDCSRFFRNNGDKTFTKISNLFNTNNMESFAAGDINHDGYIDIYGSYATLYNNPTNIDDVVWLNTTTGKNFITLTLKGDVSNIDAIGARATLYSTLGIQLREVRAGESYGTTNSSHLHFGMDTVTVIDSIVIRWPSGTMQTLINPQVNQFITIVENDCISPTSAIDASGPLVLCQGQSVTLTAPAGFGYLWLDGTTGQSIMVNAAGEYSVQVTEAGNNCIGLSPTVEVTMNPDETPAIAASADLEFCDGQSVDLSGPANVQSYTWSNGDTTQIITVTATGSYYLSIVGLCQVWTSDTLDVMVHTPTTPTSNDAILNQPGSTTLTASGNNISWYDAPAGGTLLGTGNNFITPVLTDTTVYYVESAEIYNQNNATGLKYSPNSYSGSGNTNALMEFSVQRDCELQSVKVYTDLAGERLIEVRNAMTNALVDSQLVNVTLDSQVVALNFQLAPGFYTLGTNQTVNQQIPGWGANGPRFTRSGSGVNYPYTVPNVLSVTGSDQGATFYYYFYDWKIEYETSCPSIRVPVTVFVTSPVGVGELNAEEMSVYPNPASTTLNIRSATGIHSEVQLTDNAGRLLLNEHMNDMEFSLDISTVPAGVYQLKISNAKVNNIYKVVIQ